MHKGSPDKNGCTEGPAGCVCSAVVARTTHPQNFSRLLATSRNRTQLPLASHAQLLEYHRLVVETHTRSHRGHHTRFPPSQKWNPTFHLARRFNLLSTAPIILNRSPAQGLRQFQSTTKYAAFRLTVEWGHYPGTFTSAPYLIPLNSFSDANFIFRGSCRGVPGENEICQL